MPQSPLLLGNQVITTIEPQGSIVTLCIVGGEFHSQLRCKKRS
jgi:hypothetical protein